MFRNQVSISLLTFFSSFCFRYPLQCWPYPFCWTRSPRSEKKMQKNLQLISQLFGTSTLKLYLLFFRFLYTYQSRNFTSICMLFLDCIINLVSCCIVSRKKIFVFWNKVIGQPPQFIWFSTICWVHPQRKSTWWKEIVGRYRNFTNFSLGLQIDWVLFGAVYIRERLTIMNVKYLK